MSTVTIRAVPPDTLAVLRRRAAAAEQSLQEYLRGRLIECARVPTVDEALARLESRMKGTFTLASAAAAVRADRDGR